MWVQIAFEMGLWVRIERIVLATLRFDLSPYGSTRLPTTRVGPSSTSRDTARPSLTSKRSRTAGAPVGWRTSWGGVEETTRDRASRRGAMLVAAAVLGGVVAIALSTRLLGSGAPIVA